MTILRQSAMRELERLPEDKITFVLQIMRGINGLDEDERLAKKNAFKRLEHLRKKADINENDELKRYREEKYGRYNFIGYKYFIGLFTYEGAFL